MKQLIIPEKITSKYVFPAIECFSKSIVNGTKLMARQFILFKSMGFEEIEGLMIPCESGGVFKIGMPKIDVLGLLQEKSAGTARITKQVSEPTSK